MAHPQPQDVLGRLTLVTGPEEFLGERAISGVRAAVRAHDAEAEFSETMAASLTMAELGDLASPSLFSATRCVVVRGLEDLPEESAPGLLDYAAAPADDVALVLAHSGGPKGSGLLGKLRKLPAVTEVKSAPLDGPRVPRVRGQRAARPQGRASTRTRPTSWSRRSARTSARCRRRPASSPTTSRASRSPSRWSSSYFGGRAEAKSFAVADHTLYGQTAKALEELRWALDRGTAPVLVTSAMAGGLRSLAKFMSAPRGLRNADLMREVGVPPLEARHPARAVPRLGRRRRGPGDPLGRPGGRRHQGPGQRPVLRAGEDGPRRRPARCPAADGRRDAPDSRKAPHPAGSGASCGERLPQSEAAFFWIADLRLAAWFLWMTPFEAALSSCLAGVGGERLGLVGVAGLGGLAELAHGGLQRRLHGLVALVRSVVLPVALDLGLDVRHVRLASFGVWFCEGSGGVRTAVQTRRETISAALCATKSSRAPHVAFRL